MISGFDAEDRRSHIRIKDKVFLKYEKLSQKEYDELVKNLLEGVESPFLEYSLQWVLPKLDVPIRRLREKDEVLAKVLEVMDTKLNMIINFLTLQHRKDTPGSPLVVDLSAAGIGFECREKMEVGQILKLDILLLPEQYLLRCFGEVVRLEKGEALDHKLGVNFIWITEDDRERLIEHIFQKQVIQLRLRRDKREGD